MELQETVSVTHRKIPASAINLFQLIYILIRDYEKKSGAKAMNLSLGNPDTVPNSDILALQAKCAQNPHVKSITYEQIP